MQRVVILGRGGSGKSTLARQLGEITGLRVIELDKIFWQPGLRPTPRERWVEIQQELAAEDEWIMDGDLGPYDAVEVRLRAADTVLFLDFSLLRCAWRALRRSREGRDFWLWLLQYRWKSRPLLMKAISEYASVGKSPLKPKTGLNGAPAKSPLLPTPGRNGAPEKSPLKPKTGLNGAPAAMYILRNPKDVRRFVANAASSLLP
jgi:adenylate kinase family enzyme